jgi:D-3-phosphoglycerate dehydrogenase
VKAATAKGVVVMNTPFGNAITTAEHAIAMMFQLRARSSASERTQKGEWPKKDYIGIELFAKTLGLIGAGNIGSIVDRAIGLK